MLMLEDMFFTRQGAVIPFNPDASGQTRGHRVFDHTADIGLEAWGATLEEAFAEAAHGLQAIIVPHDSVCSASARMVQVTAADEAALLVTWLSELLYLFDTGGWLTAASDIVIQAPSKLAAGSALHADAGTWRLSANCSGELYDHGRHELGVGVKAVSYHQLAVGYGHSGVCARVVLDV